MLSENQIKIYEDGICGSEPALQKVHLNVMVYYKLYTTLILSNVTWSRHDVTGKLLICDKTTIIHSNQLSKGWIISYSRFNCFNSLSLFTNYSCFHTFKIFSSKYGRDCNVCFYFNHWFCKADLTFARHVNVQITNMTHGCKDSDKVY